MQVKLDITSIVRLPSLPAPKDNQITARSHLCVIIAIMANSAGRRLKEAFPFQRPKTHKLSSPFWISIELWNDGSDARRIFDPYPAFSACISTLTELMDRASDEATDRRDS